MCWIPSNHVHFKHQRDRRKGLHMDRPKFILDSRWAHSSPALDRRLTKSQPNNMIGKCLLWSGSLQGLDLKHTLDCHFSSWLSFQFIIIISDHFYRYVCCIWICRWWQAWPWFLGLILKKFKSCFGCIFYPHDCQIGSSSRYYECLIILIILIICKIILFLTFDFSTK